MASVYARRSSAAQVSQNARVMPNAMPGMALGPGLPPILPTDPQPLTREIIQEQSLSRAQAETDFPPVKITALNFELLSAEQIERDISMSGNQFDKDSGAIIINSDAKEGKGTINDPRLGTIDITKPCGSCGLGPGECFGHMGAIKLARKVLNPELIPMIITVLSSICFYCGVLILSPNELVKQGFATVEETVINRDGKEVRESKVVLKPGLDIKLIAAKSVNASCKGNRVAADSVYDPNNNTCLINPIFSKKRSKTEGIIWIFDTKSTAKDQDRPLSGEEVYSKLSLISKEDAELLGFHNGSHPKDMVLSYLPVLPRCARGVSTYDGIVGDGAYDEILTKIIKLNNTVGDYTVVDRESAYRQLVSHIRWLFNNSAGEYKTRGGRGKFLGYYQFLGGKKGFVRMVVMGRRANFTGRTVAGPGGGKYGDPTNLRLGEVGVPEEMASVLTRRVRVTAENIAALTDLLRGNPAEGIPGKVNSIVRARGDYRGAKILITDQNRATIRLEIGDKVDRWLQDGDYVLINRQPSLHKHSMMAHRVRLHPGINLLMHISTTPGYNLDYDGDELNIHVLQSEEAVLEAATLMTPQANAMNPKTNRPIVSLVYDKPLAASLLTQVTRDAAGQVTEEVMVSDFVWDECMKYLELDKGENRQVLTLEKRCEEKLVPPRSGRALFSALLPEDFYYRKGEVLIENGVLIRGEVQKQHIGNSPCSIIQKLYLDPHYGMDVMANFISYANWVLNEFLYRRGFTVSISSVYPITDERSGLLEQLEKRVVARNNMLEEVDKLLWETRRLSQLSSKLQPDSPAFQENSHRLRGIAQRLEQLSKLHTDNEQGIQALQPLLQKTAGLPAKLTELRAKEEALMMVQLASTRVSTSDPLEQARLEQEANVVLQNMYDTVAKESRNVVVTSNSIRRMVVAESKGANFNMMQIFVMLGQGFLHGKRPPKNISGGTRCLPHFDYDDPDPAAQGFCRRSFVEGLDPAQTFFHMMFSRTGLVNTSISTGIVGQVHRRLVKATEDLLVDYRGAVIDGNGNVVSPSYGGDAFTGERLMPITFEGIEYPSAIEIDDLVARLNAEAEQEEREAVILRTV